MQTDLRKRYALAPAADAGRYYALENGVERSLNWVKRVDRNIGDISHS